MGDWRRRIWLFDRLVWTVLRSKDMGVEREEEGGEARGEILEVGAGGGCKNARIYN